MLKDFVRLYSHAMSILDLVKQDDENFQCFYMKKGLPVKLVETKLHIKDIYPLKSFYGFFEKHPYFWMIPIANPTHKICGFILRGYFEKDYRTVFEYSQDNLAPLFGWEDFGNFELDQPVVLCEGIKDAIFLKQHYPYVLSVNGSEITSVNVEILKRITSKVILCYDNDKTGKYSSSKDIKMLSEFGFNCKVLLPLGEVKDCAEYIRNTYCLDRYLRALKYNIQELGGEVCGIC